MRQIEATSSDAEPYLTFELISRTPAPPDLAKTRRFQRDPDTTKFVRQPVDDTVPFSTFEGAELAIMPVAVAPKAERRQEDDSIEIEIVESGEIARVEALPEASMSIEISASALEPFDQPEPPSVVVGADTLIESRPPAATVQLSPGALDRYDPLDLDGPIESSFLLPVAVAEPIAVSTPAVAGKPPAWRLPLIIAVFLASAFACGIGAAFALS